MQGNIYPVKGRGGEQVFPITSDKAVVISGEENKRLSEKWNDIYSKSEVDQLIPNPNLLDNSDFTNPVNQRGNTIYTVTSSDGEDTSIYTLDRWKLSVYPSSYGVTEGKVELTDSGILLYSGSTLEQYLENPLPVNDVTYSIDSDSGAVVFYDGQKIKIFSDTTSGSYVTIRHIKLEKGSIATPWQPKGYGAELAECLRYFQRHNDMWILPTQLYNGNMLFCTFNYFCPMRIVPTPKFIEVAIGDIGIVTDKTIVNSNSLTSMRFTVKDQTKDPTLKNMLQISVDLSADL